MDYESSKSDDIIGHGKCTNEKPMEESSNNSVVFATEELTISRVNNVVPTQKSTKKSIISTKGQLNALSYRNVTSRRKVQATSKTSNTYSIKMNTNIEYTITETMEKESCHTEANNISSTKAIDILENNKGK